MNARTQAKIGNAAAAKATAAVRPVWTGLIRLRDLLPSDMGQDRVVLHAGPPFASLSEVPQPVRNSIAQAAVFEKWAADAVGGAALLDAGALRLMPAQDADAVVPLAGVITPSMWLHEVRDAATTGVAQYAVLNEGVSPALRVGVVEHGLIEHERWLHGPFAEWLAARVEALGSVDLLPILAEALGRGDDGHSRTAAGSALVAARLVEGDTSGFREEASTFLATAAPFALNLWMAAAALALRAAENVEGSDAVTRVGGNGVSFGFQTAREPGVWHSSAAGPPRGPVPRKYEGLSVLGAIGDSAVVDFFGLGGQALAWAPATAQALGEYAPRMGADVRAALLPAEHPVLPIRTGVTASGITRAGAGPAVLLGMIELRGLEGRLGGGVFTPPVEAFALGLNEHSLSGKAEHGELRQV